VLLRASIRSRFELLPGAWKVALCVLACLVPFINKAFYIDDPLFIWTGERVRVAPFDFYGFRVNWFGLVMPMTDATANPPLMGYFLALGSLVGGWSEVSLHVFALIPAVALAIGSYRLARLYSAKPLLAAVLLVISPGFLVCATSLMCDVLMAAFWVWAILLWEQGLKDGKLKFFIYAVLLAGACALSKYSGLSLIPLLFALGLFRRRKLGLWAVALLIPLLMVGAYEWTAWKLYGVSLFQNASDYAQQVRPTSLADMPERLISGLVFTGGCALPLLLLSPSLWDRRTLWRGSGLLVLAFLAPSVLQPARMLYHGHGMEPGVIWSSAQLHFAANWALDLQRAFFFVTGVALLWVVAVDYRQRREPTSVVLALWVVGVLLFACVLNWTINGRSILPLLPAAGILIARRVEFFTPSPLTSFRHKALGTAALIGLAVAYSDYSQAGIGRAAARELAAKYPKSELTYEGHWGFQYYLQKVGTQPLDAWYGTNTPGQFIAIPAGNDIYELRPEATRLTEVLRFQPLRWLSTLNRYTGAGFHTDFWGPLPFAFGRTELERFYVYRVVQPFRFAQGRALFDLQEPATLQKELTASREAILKNPQDADSRFQLATLLVLAGKSPEAIAEFSEVLRVQPEEPNAHAQLGELYEQTGRTLEARDQYKAALETMPDFPAILNNLAWLLSTDPDPSVRNGKEAVRAAERACALTAHRSAIYMGTLAAAYAEAGRFGEAIATAETARDLAYAAGQPALAVTNARLLELYRRGKAYHPESR
jgi:tetratricopeptide (TPR) repeat protein